MKYTSYRAILNSVKPQELASHPDRDHLLRMQYKEEYAARIHSTLSDNTNTDKFVHTNSLWREALLKSPGMRSPISYLQSLPLIDQQHIIELLGKALFKLPHRDSYKGGVYYGVSGIDMVLAVGSSVQDAIYREGLEQSSAYKTPAAEARIQKRGNDIDLMLCNTKFDHPRYYVNHGDHQQITRSLISKIEQLLQARELDYELVEGERKDGTEDMLFGDTLHTYEVIDYTTLPHFIVRYPEGRPIHLTLSKEAGDTIWKREYLQGRVYSTLIGHDTEQFLFGDINFLNQYLAQVTNGEAVEDPFQLTLDEKLQQLNQRKRANYQQKKSNREGIKRQQQERRDSASTGEFPF